VISFTALERRKCQHRFESGQTRAFADALKVRGFLVVDRTDVAFVPGAAPENVDGLVSGEITDYWWEREVRVGGSYNTMTNFSDLARCTITVRAHARASGEKLWEKTYSREVGASGGIGNPDALTQVLARTVRGAVMDRELVEQLGGARDARLWHPWLRINIATASPAG
jgi:hypothetical protein